MNCPFCGNSMKRGFLNGPPASDEAKTASLCWAEIPNDTRSKDIIKLKDINGVINRWQAGPATVAFYCGDCNKVIIDINGEE